MKRARIAVIIAAAAIVAPLGAAAAEDDFEAWSTTTASGPLTGPLLASLELSIRADDRGTRGPTTLIRSALGYEIAENVSLWAGYVRVDTRLQGRTATGENRYFQQLSWALGSAGGVAVASRTRLEQRTIEGAADTGWRVRQQFRATVPVRKAGPTAVLSSEAFVALNTTDFGASKGLDQWRNFAGINVPATKYLSVEIGYLNRYVQRRGARDRVDHIVPLTLGLRF